MSLIYFNKNHEYGTSVIWKFEKNSSVYSDELKCNAPSGIIKGSTRELEWLASRYLAYRVDNILPKFIKKDQYGKPSILNGSKHISISHSRNYASYSSSLSPIGIDIQIINDKIHRVSHKFTSDQELRKFPKILSLNDKLHYTWTIKEAVFKLYGRKELPFKEGILITSSSFSHNQLITYGYILKHKKNYKFKAISKMMHSFFFTTSHYHK